MAVKVLIGDLFQSDAQTLVNTVNCVGVMGKGIALEFKKRFPERYKDYVFRCNQGKVKLGQPYLFQPLVLPWVLNFPTKDHWRSLAKAADIIVGLEYLLKNYKSWSIKSLAVPPLGSGLGQLEWRIIGPILFKYLNRLDIPVELYAPHGTPTDELELSFLVGNDDQNQLTLKSPSSEWISSSWIALIEIINRIENQPYHWPIGRTSFQKLAFISMTEGLPLDIEFQRRSYGPYSLDLKKKVSLLINNGLIQEYRSGRMFEVHTGPTYKIAYSSYLSDLKQWQNIIEKVSDLFMRVNTKQAEVIATVIYVTNELREANHDSPTEMDVYKEVLNWKQRRTPPIDNREVASTIRNLASLGWLGVKASQELPLPEDVFLGV